MQRSRIAAVALVLAITAQSLSGAASIPRRVHSCLPRQTGPAPVRTLDYCNPILHQDWSDPDVCRVGDDYYLTASSFNCFPGLPVLHSRDLVHWTQIGAALTDYPGAGWEGPEHDFRTRVQHGNGVWAPAIRYHDGWFYIFCGDPDRGIFMVRTQDPAGVWEAPVWLVRGKGFIDPCPLWDEDGRAWLSHALAGSRAGLKSVLLVAPMAPDGRSLLGPSRVVYDGHLTQPTIEGTKFYQREGQYYIFAPAGGVATGWQTVLRASDPFGPYEERIVMASDAGSLRGKTSDVSPRHPVTNGPHQGAWVTAPDGTDWFVHFQDKDAYGRIVHLQPMAWGADGWPVIGADPDGDGCGAPVLSAPAPVGTCADGTKTLDSVPSRRKTARDGTKTPASVPSVQPGPYGIAWDWQYPAVPSPYWHYALPDGGVRLYSVEQAKTYRNLWDCPNLLQQKFPAESFSVSARLVFRPNPQLKGRGEQAGFVVMGSDYAGLRMVDTEEGPVLEWIVCRKADQGAAEEVRRLALLRTQPRPVVHDRESVGVAPVAYPDYQETVVYVRLEVGPGGRLRQGASSILASGVIRSADNLSAAAEGAPVFANRPAVAEAVCRFSYSLDGKKFVPLDEKFVAQPGRWIGAKWGFYCNRYAPKNDSGSLDVTELIVQKHE